jgi:glutamate-1-semialdehyde 2,1-aminomutase
MTPLVAQSGKGDILTDVDGRRYIDYCMSWGALILGHAHPQVVEAATKRLEMGSSFGVTTEVELLLASQVIKHYPSMEKVRFVSSGTEATMTALRLSRGFTGKPLIIKFNGHYHGHADSLLIQAGSGVSYLPQASSKGIPEDLIKNTLSLPFNDVELCRRVLRQNDQIAAVILEPIAGNMGVVPANSDFVQMLCEETAKAGALLIFDEVINGFRVGLKGAQGHYQIKPDLTCLGKIVGGGFPAAAFGGRREIMDLLAPLGGVYQAGTLSGNPVAMAAGLQTLQEVEREGFYETLEEHTRILIDPIQEWIRNKDLPLCLQRVGSMFTLFFGVKKVERREDLQKMDGEMFLRFFKYLFEEGVYLAPSAYEASFVSMAHSKENLQKTSQLILQFLQKQFL